VTQQVAHTWQLAVRGGHAIGRRSVPPVIAPSTDEGEETGRERPRLSAAKTAPEPASGVAHAPVSVSSRPGNP
jgi:hypothetical protein